MHDRIDIGETGFQNIRCSDNVRKHALYFTDEFLRVLSRQRSAAEIGRASVHFHPPRLRHAANVGQRHRLAELHLSLAIELAQQIGEMERTAGVTGIEQDALAVDRDNWPSPSPNIHGRPLASR